MSVKGEVITEALLIGPLGSADLGKRLGAFSSVVIFIHDCNARVG